MILTVALSLAITGLAVVYWIGKACVGYHQYERSRKAFGCPSLKRYPSWDRILGLDYVAAMFKALKEHRFLEFQKDTYSAAGGVAWTANFMGNRMVYTSHPENMKAMSTSHAESFGIEPIRYANGAITPFTGRGVNSSDGERWRRSRELVRPYFDREGFTNLGRLEVHVDRLLSKIPVDGSMIDMQPLFQRWVSATNSPAVHYSSFPRHI
jgi:cytochrome P450